MTRLLLVSEQAEWLKATLQKHRTYEVDALTDPPRGIFEFVARHRPRLILVDVAWVQPPEVFFRQLAQVSPHTGVICLANLEQRDQAVPLLQHSAVEYLCFPLTETELLTKIQRWLEYHRLKQGVNLESIAAAEELSLLLLNEITHEILQTLQLDEALNAILTKATLLTRAVASTIWLANPEGGPVGKPQLSKSLTADDPPVDADVVVALMAQVQQTKQMAFVEHPLQKYVSIALPLVVRGKLIGVLALTSKNLDAFSRGVVQKMTLFCQQAAVALENASLFHQLASAYIDLDQSREEILRNRNMLSAIFDSISDGLIILDAQLNIRVVNRIEAKQQGHSPAELIGQNFATLPGPASAPGLMEQIKSAIISGRENLWIAPETELAPYLKDREFRIYPIKNQLAQTEQVVVLANNISKLRQWQASLFRSANLAAVGQLAGSVAHQINNPLTVTMTNSQLLLLDSAPGTEVATLAGGIFRASERIQSIVANLLEFSNQEDYQFIETPLVKTIDDALALITNSLRKANVTLRADYQVLPMVTASVSHLKLVWINLILNARDAAVEQSHKPEITISTRLAGPGLVAVTVIDNGPGIPPEQADMIFNPFFTTKSKDKALGMGLYSARVIVEQHGGQISVISPPGGGAALQVMLPVEPSSI